MYYVSTGDSVDLGYTPLTPVYMRKNISAVEIAGAEFGVTYKMNPHINLFANYAYNYAVIKNFIVVNPALDIDLSGKHLADVPKHLASAGFTWLNPYINATITGSYTGKMYINDKNEFDNTYLMSNQYPSYFVADFKLWKTLFKHLELSVEMKNIFNYIYHDSKDQVSPGRLVFGEISYKF
jgi:outer membrane receptor protein involved in Fe transport